MKYAELTADLEHDLVVRWQAGDRAAAAILVQAHEGVLWELVGKHAPPGPAQEDAMQNARLGFLKGALRHDLRTTNRLAAYAGDWARGEALKRADEDTTIAVRRHVVDEARQHERAGEALPDDLALAMMLRGSESLDAPTRDLRSGRGFANVTLAQLIRSEDPTPEDLLDAATADARRRAILEKAFLCLNAREREIVRRSELLEEPESLADIGRSLGLTRERVRQIHDAAMPKLERALRRLLTDADAALWGERRRADEHSEAA